MRTKIKCLLLCVMLFAVHSLLSAQQTVGIFLNDSLAQNGYTLFAPNSSRTTFLIDNCGYEVHRWQSSFIPGVSAYLLPNGNLLRTARIGGAFQGGGIGGRIELYDWDNNLLWGYNYVSATYHQHHDVEYLPNGNILVLAWEKKSLSESVEAGRLSGSVTSNGLWPEHIVELKPEGNEDAEIVWEWHLWDHLIQDVDDDKPNFGVVADHPELMDINYTGPNIGSSSADWIHANSIDYHPEFDQIIISSRALSEFWVIDHSTTTAEAAGHTGGRYGKGGDLLYRWGNPESYDRGNSADRQIYGQHDVHWIEEGLNDEGKIICFNNGGGRPGGNYSSVDIIDPPVDSEGRYTLENDSAFGPDNLFWSYTGDPLFSLFSSNISGAQRLPNGNTLICEGSTGHFLEVTQNGKVVWDYINPISGNNPVQQGNVPGNNSVFRAYKFKPDYMAFEGKDLTPGPKIELNPFDDDCMIYTDLTTSIEYLTIDGIAVFPNPIEHHLSIKNTYSKELKIDCFDIAGIHHLNAFSAKEQLFIPTVRWPKGIYFVRILDVKEKHFKTFKIVKQ